MAASARGKMVGVVRRQGWLWPRPELQPGAAVAIGGSLAPGVAVAPVVLI